MRTPSNGGTEPEAAILCNQARRPGEGPEYQPRHKKFNPQSVLAERRAGAMVVQS